ncbi:hypothetical protein [Allokutzneria albata]|uniref:Uncharacterized protein n=1 Tax=Allokutzneria albata TaxID=211114 RepID=A0A1G9UDF5_ALLAB|nr:hypothetical protein [Allokutzneria albata]SDM57754.1 hypothetical protein SAMN04489726_2338 [Allokutzneria albata]
MDPLQLYLMHQHRESDLLQTAARRGLIKRLLRKRTREVSRQEPGKRASAA